jgi:hypothetical protein
MSFIFGSHNNNNKTNYDSASLGTTVFKILKALTCSLEPNYSYIKDNYTKFIQ